MKFSVVIVAAGKGNRFGKDKMLASLLGKPVFLHSLELFRNYTDDIVCVANTNNISEIQKYHNNVILGADTRMLSVYKGVKATKYDHIIVHDGARPYLTKEDVEKLINNWEENTVAYLYTPVINTIRYKTTHQTLNRDELISALTPQAFPKDEYYICFAKALTVNKVFTDEVDILASFSSLKINALLGLPTNIKITTPEDIKEEFRIGHSWDIHRLVENRPLILGGITIPFAKGLLGHSDADCLLHAISEALLGALALGDLGKHFPDTASENKDLDSSLILAECYKKIKKANYVVNNLDCMIYCEAPKLAPYIDLMREKVASILEISSALISIKATTYERLGEIGENKAIASEATVLLIKKQ